MPGPRQLFDGTSRRDLAASECETLEIIIKTSATMLRNLFPSSRFRFEKPDTVAHASLRIQTLSNLDWLGGHGYNLLGFYIHNVQYTDDVGLIHEGSYLPVMFEDMAEPIISGREELGFPKVFSGIAIKKESDTRGVTMSWKGTEWCKIHVAGLRKDARPLPPVEASMSEKIFVHKLVHTRGGALSMPDADYVAMIDTKSDSLQACPQSMESWNGTAKITFNPCNASQLPTLHHIVSRLAELPIFDVVDVLVIHTSGVPNYDSLVRL